MGFMWLGRPVTWSGQTRFRLYQTCLCRPALVKTTFYRQKAVAKTEWAQTGKEWVIVYVHPHKRSFRRLCFFVWDKLVGKAGFFQLTVNFSGLCQQTRKVEWDPSKVYINWAGEVKIATLPRRLHVPVERISVATAMKASETIFSMATDMLSCRATFLYKLGCMDSSSSPECE